MGVAIGVDSHKSSLAVAALDELGRVGEDERVFQRCRRTQPAAVLGPNSKPPAIDLHRRSGQLWRGAGTPPAGRRRSRLRSPRFPLL
jgi:hypothetical protein